MKRFRARATWTWRRAGGIFLGVRLCFPVAVLYPDDMETAWNTWSLSVGVIALTFHFDLVTTRNTE